MPINLILCPLGHHFRASESVSDETLLLRQVADSALNPLDIVDVQVDTLLEYVQLLLHYNLKFVPTRLDLSQELRSLFFLF